MGEPLQPSHDIDRTAYPPLGNPELSMVEGRDTLHPRTPEQYVEYGCNSFSEIEKMMQRELSRRDELAGETRLVREHSFFMNHYPNTHGFDENVAPEPVSESEPALRESEQYRTIALPPGVGAIGDFAVAWDKYNKRGGVVIKIRPEVPMPGMFTIEGDEENLSMAELLRQQAVYEARVKQARDAQNNAPEYTWESEHPDRIKVTRHNGAPEEDLRGMSAGDVVSIARFARATARLIAINYGDTEALANLMPVEHNPEHYKPDEPVQGSNE